MSDFSLARAAHVNKDSVCSKKVDGESCKS